jgi:hypothetical protein
VNLQPQSLLMASVAARLRLPSLSSVAVSSPSPQCQRSVALVNLRSQTLLTASVAAVAWACASASARLDPRSHMARHLQAFWGYGGG